MIDTNETPDLTEWANKELTPVVQGMVIPKSWHYWPAEKITKAPRVVQHYVEPANAGEWRRLAERNPSGSAELVSFANLRGRSERAPSSHELGSCRPAITGEQSVRTRTPPGPPGMARRRESPITSAGFSTSRRVEVPRSRPQIISQARYDMSYRGQARIS